VCVCVATSFVHDGELRQAYTTTTTTMTTGTTVWCDAVVVVVGGGEGGGDELCASEAREKRMRRGAAARRDRDLNRAILAPIKVREYVRLIHSFDRSSYTSSTKHYDVLQW